MADHETDPALRPRSLGDFVGQRDVIANIGIAINAARQSGRTLDHGLLAGSSGCGKSSLANVIASELGARLHVTSGPAIEHKGELASLLAALEEGDVLFVDEIHRLRPALQEYLYPAMENFRFDMFVGSRSRTKAITIPIPHFTLLGATTRPGLLAAPFRDRFGHCWHLRTYELDDMTAIVRRSANMIGLTHGNDGAVELARRSRGTPRVANRLLRRARDFAESAGVRLIDQAVVATALDQLGVDGAGLDALDRAYLGAICDRFGGGPVGIEAIAASLGEDRETLEDIEPCLLACGFVVRTARGRVAAAAGIAHWRGFDDGPTAVRSSITPC